MSTRRRADFAMWRRRGEEDKGRPRNIKPKAFVMGMMDSVYALVAIGCKIWFEMNTR